MSKASLKPPEDLRITITDITASGYCPSGTRRWFEERGLDFRAFLKEGIAATELLDKGDALAERVVRDRMEWRRRG